MSDLTLRVPLADLRPAPWNPRLIKDARFQQLCRSLQADPDFMNERPILATADGTIYAGNMRYRAAEHLGWETVPARLADIPEQLAKERALRDNNQFGEWQEQELAELLAELQTQGSDLALLGFDSGEVERLLDSVGLNGDTPAPEAQIDRAEELREQWGTERGQLWLVGRHRLLCGDSTSAEDVARLMGGERAAMVWTDPPYGVEYVGKTKDALTIANDGASDLPGLLRAVFANIDAATMDAAPFYIAHPAGALCLTFGNAILAVGWKLHQTLIWVKDSMVLGHSDYHFRHEPIYYGWTSGTKRRSRGAPEELWYGDDAQVSVFEIPRPKRSEDHPTMKPPELVAAHIWNSSQLGDLLYDPFLGSGTTMVAAEQAGRVCYGMEIEPKYVAVALQRMADMGLEPRLADG